MNVSMELRYDQPQRAISASQCEFTTLARCELLDFTASRATGEYRRMRAGEVIRKLFAASLMRDGSYSDPPAALGQESNERDEKAHSP